MRWVTSAQRVAGRWERHSSQLPVDADFIPTLAKALAIHEDIQAWVAQFGPVLRKALDEAEGLPEGWVWQDRLIAYWRKWDRFEVNLKPLDAVFEGLYLGSTRLESEANEARNSTYDPPAKARIEYGFGEFDFFPYPKTERDHIAYPVSRLKAWAEAMGAWARVSARSLRDLERKAKRKLS